MKLTPEEEEMIKGTIFDPKVGGQNEPVGFTQSTSEYEKKHCSFGNCKVKLKAKGLCHIHYRRLIKGIPLDIACREDDRPAIIEGDIAKIPLGVNAKDGYAIVDESLSFLEVYKWGISNQGYPIANYLGKQIKLHKMLSGQVEKGLVVDHINGNKLDNRVANLRIVSVQQNSRNRAPNLKRKYSPYKGVDLHPNGRWKATLRYKDKKRINLGYFDTPEDAAQAYNEAAKIYHGEFARLNVIPQSTNKEEKE